MQPTRANRGRSTPLGLGASLAIAALCVAVVPSAASAASAFGGKLKSAGALRESVHQDSNAGTVSPAARRSMRLGYLVPHQARYDRRKTRITRRAATRRKVSAPVNGPLAPSLVSGAWSWQGIHDPMGAPPDETSAVGKARYIELVNRKFAVYSKASRLLSRGDLNALVNAPSTVNVFDPQIIWDPTTNRFYYAADAVVSDTENFLAFGFSKSAKPTSAGDWCQYFVDTGKLFADYPKLGDSRFFALIGTNLFTSDEGTPRGSDLLALSKPSASDSCGTYPDRARLDDKALPRTVWTPTPANEIDNDSTGWAVTTAPPWETPANRLRLFKVTRAANGDPAIATRGTNVGVSSYAIPPSVPQSGSKNLIDSLDARNTQAVAGVDPAHNHKLAIWTQHTVRGGAGAEVRWYEIDPAGHRLFQSGRVTSPSLYAFNGAISPNRQVNGDTRSGGDAMIVNFNSSSNTTFPSIGMVSKTGAEAQSAPITVRNGTRPVSGGDCSAPDRPCRWGDYAAATPDPTRPNRIWQVSQFANGSGSGTTWPATSRTWNFVARP